MADRMVRIEKITIENFKNVAYGTVDFENKRKEFRASILGMYGQNGSGKTALIDAIKLLKFALRGKPVPQKYADYIKVDEEYATLKYEFVVRFAQINYRVWYQFCMRKTEADSSTEENDTAETVVKVELFDEVLSFSYESKEDKMRKTPLIDTRGDELFSPKAKLVELVGEKKMIMWTYLLRNG